MTTAALLLLGASPAASAQGREESDQVRFRASDIEVTIWFRDRRVKPLESQLRELITNALASYSTIFGATPSASDGSRLVRLTVRVGLDRSSAGSTEPATVNVVVGRDEGARDWRLVLLHEMLHLWHGESVRPAGPAERWLLEGTAEFYGRQIAARTRVMDSTRTIQAVLDDVASYLSTTTGSGPLAAGTALPTGPTAPAGFLAALIIDRDIRARSEGRRSLDDVLRWLFEHHERQRPYTNLDVVRAAREATATDLTEFFARHVMGGLPLAVSDSLGLAAPGRGGVSQAAVGVAAETFILQSLGIRPGT